jgi:hypothetical protein
MEGFPVALTPSGALGYRSAILEPSEMPSMTKEAYAVGGLRHPPGVHTPPGSA